MPKLDDQEFQDYSNSVDTVAEAKIALESAQSIVAQRIAEYRATLLNHTRIIRNLSVAHTLPLYEGDFDVDLLTHEITMKKKEK